MGKKKKYGVIYDKSGKSIGVSGTTGPIGIQGACSHPGPPGVAGPPGYPPYVGQFRWCHSCGHVRFFRIEGGNQFLPSGESHNTSCPTCKRDTAYVYDAWCPDDVILTWEEEVVQ